MRRKVRFDKIFEFNIPDDLYEKFLNGFINQTIRKVKKRSFRKRKL